MGFKTVDSGIAASIFLGLYFFYTMAAAYVIFKKGWRHIYTLLLMFGIVRLGAQLCGVAFSVLGFSHWQWLIAYLVLGAEGYFVLIYTSFRFICNAQKREMGSSWIMKTGPNFKFRLLNILFGTWLKIFHQTLIPANSLVISGGSMLAGIDTDDYSQNHGTIVGSKILRTVGQSLFLSLTMVTIILNCYVYQFEKIRNYVTQSIILASPFLFIRGIFGILSIYISDMNYFQLSNYSGNGFSNKLVIYEYVLATTMEFVSAIFLLSNYFFEERNYSNVVLRPPPEEEKYF